MQLSSRITHVYLDRHYLSIELSVAGFDHVRRYCVIYIDGAIDRHQVVSG